MQKKEKNAYGLVKVQSGEELKFIIYIKVCPFSLNMIVKDRGISVHI